MGDTNIAQPEQEQDIVVAVLETREQMRIVKLNPRREEDHVTCFQRHQETCGLTISYQTMIMMALVVFLLVIMV